MQPVAESDCFRHIFYGLQSIGGRYSALSDFGTVPAAIMGLDVSRFLNMTEEMCPPVARPAAEFPTSSTCILYPWQVIDACH
jgi:transaldolase / glucose-6-phosphate isomerase